MTIFDLVTSNEIVAYWELSTQDREPYFTEELFPAQQKLGLKIEQLKGAKGLPVVLKPSAFDVAAIPRPRIGISKLSMMMPFFKESKYIDEELRQMLNMVMETGNRALVDSVIMQIFDDEVELLEGAAAQRERMRCMMLTTGTIVIEANGQLYQYDYGMPADHKATAEVSWSDPNANIMDNIRTGIDKIRDDTGAVVERAICSGKVIGYLRKNKTIISSLTNAETGERYISDDKILSFISDELGVQFVKNDKRYKDENGVIQRYIPEDTITLFPSGKLGTTWFGTTPEQSDLLNSRVANVSITDTGVAVTTSQKVDPVQVDTKVSQICLPDFPTADQVYILDVIKE